MQDIRQVPVSRIGFKQPLVAKAGCRGAVSCARTWVGCKPTCLCLQVLVDNWIYPLDVENQSVQRVVVVVMSAVKDSWLCNTQVPCSLSQAPNKAAKESDTSLRSVAKNRQHWTAGLGFKPQV